MVGSCVCSLEGSIASLEHCRKITLSKYVHQAFICTQIIISVTLESGDFVSCSNSFYIWSGGVYISALGTLWEDEI